MLIEQIAVFVENKAGRLAAITRLLADKDISIHALAVADTSDFGILRLIVDKVEEAIAVLQEDGFTVGKTEVIGVEFDNHAGGLVVVLETLYKAKINVEYMYAFAGKTKGNPLLIFRFENMEEAIVALQKTGIKIVDKEQISQL